jgi:HAD superfamily phosphoserine phosphatase-like hydrolase
MSSLETDRAAFFDADGTLYEGFCIFPIYDALAKEGVILNSNNEKMQNVLYTYAAGEIDYATFVGNTLAVGAESLDGSSVEEAAEVAAGFFTSNSHHWYSYVRPLIERLKFADFKIVLITAEPDFIAQGIVRALDLTSSSSSKFDFSDGIFNGTVHLALGKSEKAKVVDSLLTTSSYSIGFGDSEGDIGMLEMVDQAFCVKPSKKLEEVAKRVGWTIIDEPDSSVAGVINL